MGRKKRERIEFRFYETPRDEEVLALYGDEWRRTYGEGISILHFHNLMEVGYCVDGEGTLVLDEREIRYRPGMISVIPHNYPHTTSSDPGTQSYWEYLFFEPEHVLQTMYPGNQMLRTQMTQRVNRSAFLFEAQGEPELRNVVLTILALAKKKKEFYREGTRAQLVSLVLLIAGYNPRQSVPAQKSVCVWGGVRRAGSLGALPYRTAVHVPDQD